MIKRVKYWLGYVIGTVHLKYLILKYNKNNA